MTNDIATRSSATGFIAPMIYAALAGGMAWGIRGQYGHETGAMMAGLLVSLTLMLVLRVQGTPIQIARAAAFATLAMGFGGSMTYGQTLGLTQNPALIGNNDAWVWGMIGCAVKGGVWIGLAGAFLGMGLGGKRYRALEMALLMIGLCVLFWIGVKILNGPFDPANKQLPALYFSEHWRWEPDKAEYKPRFELWGGLWVALSMLVMYLGAVKGDKLASRMATWGILGGAIGFPGGQMIQSYAAWHREEVAQGFLASIVPYMNWWNMMEITYGTIMGAALGLGLWLNRRLISFATEASHKPMAPTWEANLFIVHIALLYLVEFQAIRYVDMFYDFGLVMAIIPMALIAGGRAYPFLQILPVITLPIAGKTFVNLVQRQELLTPWAGIAVYLFVPLAIVTVFAVDAYFRPRTEDEGTGLVRRALMASAWTFFLLNWAFFHFPWPWAEWTGRTPSGIIYIVCIFALTGYTIYHRYRWPTQKPA